MSDLLRDLRYAVRTIARVPGFAAVVVLTLAVGVGANTAIFGVVNAVLLRPFPFQEPDRLAIAWEVMPRPNDIPMFLSPPNFIDWRDRTQSFESLAAFATGPLFLSTDQDVLRLDAARMTANLLSTLGVAPIAGRGFLDSDDVPGAAPVALISNGLWQTAFGGDPGVIGSSIRLDGEVYEVVGIMGPDFDFPPPIDLEGNTVPRRNDVWMPFARDLGAASRSAHFMTVIGRLRPGTSVEAATADMNRVASELAREYPESNEGWAARVVPMNDVVVGNLRPALFVLLAAVTGVLLIACVNIANLLLSRATGRQKEFAVRAALGAGRRRLLRQAIVESQVLAFLGGALGVLLAWAGTRALIGVAPGNVPRLGEAGIDVVVIGYAFGIAALTGLVFGLVPAIRALVPDLAQWLKEGGRGSGGDTQGRMRDALVVAEVALSLLLLVSAGLLFRSFLELRGIDPGFQSEQAVSMRLTLPRAGYADPEPRATAFRLIEERVRALPGVEAAGAVMNMPLASDYQGTTLVVEGEPEPADGTNLVNFSMVTPGYFDVMEIPVLTGRAIGEQDLPDSEPTVVLNEAAVRLFLDGEDPIGRRILYNGPRRVVGVVGDVRLESLDDEPTPTMYMPYYQNPQGRGLSLVLRAGTDPMMLIDAIRREVRAVDPNVPVSEVRSLEEVVSEALASPRFSAFMMLSFSLVALFLAAVGIYGVISYATNMRTREIGVRVALGARPVDASALVLKHALRLAGLGVVVGAAAALLLTRFLESLLFGVRPTDPLTLGAVAVFLLFVAALAGWLPAWRASRIDPQRSLRYEA